MAGIRINEAIREIQGLLDLGPCGSLTDAELLERYLSGRDEAAFGAIVHRHGPMVLRVCRGVLDDIHDSQDAFQATFLVLARKARSIRRRDSAASWLHGVARRVAMRARTRLARRRLHERRFAEMSPECMTPSEAGVDHRVLDDEINRLPAAIREAVLLCCLEGMTYEMAASHLGVSEGTVRGRLARGRERLRVGLSRRGLKVPAPLVAVAASSLASSAVPASLLNSTEGIASSLLAGKAAFVAVPAPVASLAEGVIKTMFLERIRWTAAVLLAIGIPSTGAIVYAQVQSKPQQRVAAPASRRSDAEPPVKTADLKYGDGRADGKKSLGGSGEMIEFSMPGEGRKVAGLKIHGSRYGQPSPPDESFLIYFLNEDLSEVIATRMAPYSLFERGEERWVEVTFPKPVETPIKFWVALDFRPHQTKGVYVSFDASTGGKYSRSGLPGIKPKSVDFGDWMIEAVPAK
jgi:RNA polymerase sigma-70 factor (ECF subfamily)